MYTFTFDIETTGLQYGVDKVIAFCYHDSETGKYYHLSDHPSYTTHDRICDLFSRLIQDRLDTHVFIAHNIKFDLRMLDITPSLVDRMQLVDTTVLYHYVDPRGSKKLGDIETALYGTNEKNTLLETYGKQFDQWPKDELEKYNEIDVRVTLNIYKKLIDRPPLSFKTYQERLIKSIYRIEYNGFPFDSSKADQVQRDFECQKTNKLRELSRWLIDNRIESNDINYNSSKQVSTLLYDTLGIEKPSRELYPQGKAFDKLFTATMTNAELLRTINHPFVKLYLELKAIQSTLTFINTYKELSVKDRLYPSFNVTGTITGRLSCSKPNLQNIKKKSVDQFSPRSLFIPEEGDQLVSIDYQQQEIRMLAVLSQDKHLLELVQMGTDMHTAVGTKMLGKSVLTKDERDTFKSLHFGLLYGLSMGALAFKLGCADFEAQQLVEDYYTQFPDVYQWMQDAKKEVQFNGYITLWTGRKWISQPGLEYQAINAYVQGSSAELTNLTTILLDKYLTKSGNGRILSIIHDEFLFNLNDISCIPDLVSIMEQTKLFGVPFLTDTEIVDTY